MRPVSDEASRDAWLLLACAVDWEGVSFKKSNMPGGGSAKGNHIHLHSCGHGFTPDEIASVSEEGQRRFIHHSACMGASPSERRVFYRQFYRRNQ